MEKAIPCAYRPFPCEIDHEERDEFLKCVIGTHEITIGYYLDKTESFFKRTADTGFPFSIALESIPDACDNWLLEVRFDASRITNDDISPEWIEWRKGWNPVPESGLVYFSVPLMLAINEKRHVETIELCKAHEIVNGVQIVAVSLKGFDVDGNLTYVGNLTSMIPKSKEDNCLP